MKDMNSNRRTELAGFLRARRARLSPRQALSPRFAGMWAEHEVEVRGPMRKHVVHPEAGSLEFECQVLHIAETGQRLIAYCAVPGSATEAAFAELAARAPLPA